MENPYSGGTWMMIPNNNNNNTTSINTPSSSTTSNPNQDLSHSHLQQQQQFLNQQQQQQRHLQQQQQQHHQSLASHFHLLHLVENLADVIENGTRDQHSDVLTVEGQKRKLEESEQLLNQRRELIAKYRSSVDELVKADR
ncbi:hypothetical protein AQUCO_01700644v1 [Aquilegia coerulea]|uniref:Mediator of RNA polymerase II transcription subunit 9 n=1 Tax=Aquilegia coerulea TaxID=218851 RepID=A0A2G5DP33_AQUCA|nr:hypothetical protein AQUCO_01700644v1 [Aquilegia coerulea]